MLRYPMGGAFSNIRAGAIQEIYGCCFSVDYTTPAGTDKTMTAYYDSAS